MTIFVHIGLNKTGSSSIQRFCHLQRDVLRKHGLEYLDIGVHDSAHYGISKLLIGKPNEGHVALASNLESAIRSSIANRMHVLISSEYFFLASDQDVLTVKAFLADFQVDSKIIVYLRRHDLWITSLFNQALKTAPRYVPWHSDIRDYTIRFLGDPKFESRYPVILDRWADQFGAANIIVRPFENVQFTMGEYLWDFLGSIKSDLPGLLKDKGIGPLKLNESIPENLLRAIGYVKSSNISNDAKDKITSLLLHADTSSEVMRNINRAWDTRSFVLAPYLRRAIVNWFSDDYRYIAERYLGSKDGVLFKEPVN